MQTVSQQLLPAPSLPQLNADGTLSMCRIKGGIHVQIPVYPGMQVGDQVSVPWEGTPAHPEIGYAAIHIVTDAIEPKTYAISYMNVYNEWQKLKIWYHVNRLGDSESVVVDIVP